MRYIVCQYQIEEHGIDIFWGPFDSADEAFNFGGSIPEDSGWYVSTVYAPPSS